MDHSYCTSSTYSDICRGQATSSHWVGFNLSNFFKLYFVNLRKYQVDSNCIYISLLNPIALFHVASPIHVLFQTVLLINQQLFLNSI